MGLSLAPSLRPFLSHGIDKPVAPQYTGLDGLENFDLATLFHKAAPAAHDGESQETHAAVERRTWELAAAELDTRFREAFARGEIAGDIVVADEEGREAKRETSSVFDNASPQDAPSKPLVGAPPPRP